MLTAGRQALLTGDSADPPVTRSLVLAEVRGQAQTLILTAGPRANRSRGRDESADPPVTRSLVLAKVRGQAQTLILTAGRRAILLHERETSPRTTG